MKIKWINTVSGETGYVKSFSAEKRYFENTDNPAEAKSFKSESYGKGIITRLESFGEGAEKNNRFEIIA
jgi:hypothetical protein